MIPRPLIGLIAASALVVAACGSDPGEPSGNIEINCADGEWPPGNGLLCFDLTTLYEPADVGDGTVLVLGEVLYVNLELDDNTNEVQDSVTLMFDLCDDDGAPDRGIVITRDGTALTASGDISNPTTGAATLGVVSVDGAGGTWKVDVQLSPKNLELTGFDDIVAAAIRVTDQSDSLRTSAWTSTSRASTSCATP